MLEFKSIKYDLRGHLRSHKVTFLLKKNILCDLHNVIEWLNDFFYFKILWTNFALVLKDFELIKL